MNENLLAVQTWFNLLCSIESRLMSIDETLKRLESKEDLEVMNLGDYLENVKITNDQLVNLKKEAAKQHENK